MPTVKCPSCHEKGKIPDTFIGHSIKCGKCGIKFLVTPPAPKKTEVGAAVASNAAAATATPAAGVPVDGIVVEGLDGVTWQASESEGAGAVANPTPVSEAVHESGAVFTTAHGPAREYKLLTQKDKFFDGKFELSRLEEALNSYARQGWVARSMTSAVVASFSGAPREELLVLLERSHEVVEPSA